MKLWDRLCDAVLPADALAGIGVVPWRCVDRATPAQAEALYAVPVSVALLLDGGLWVGPTGSVWQRWPSITDVLSMRLGQALRKAMA